MILMERPMALLSQIAIHMETNIMMDTNFKMATRRTKYIVPRVKEDKFKSIIINRMVFRHTQVGV